MMTGKDDQQAVVWVVLIGAILLAVSLSIGIGLSRTIATGPAQGSSLLTAQDGSTVAGERTPTAGLGPNASDEALKNGTSPDQNADRSSASISRDGDVLIFYFASNSVDLAENAPDSVVDIVRGAAAGKTAVISGFHDATGDAATNEELARQRAVAVRDLLLSQGLGADQLVLEKPEVLDAGQAAEARRVEVVLR